MENPRIECQKCGSVLSEDELPCPHCGSTKRACQASASVTIGVSCPRTRIRHRDSTGFLKLVSTSRNKISGVTRRKARETLVFDHTDPSFTKKSHHVEEINEEGQAEIVHHEEVTFPAKHRNPNSY